MKSARDTTMLVLTLGALPVTPLGKLVYYFMASCNISRSAATSLNSLATETAVQGALPAGDPLDMRIESLLRDWHHGPDLLFSIHPIDGSFLIW